MLTRSTIYGLFLLGLVSTYSLAQTKPNKPEIEGPIAAYQTPKSDNPAEQALRLKRDDFYTRFTFGLPSLDQLEGGYYVDCYATGVREMLSLESKTIVIGTVTNAKAFFSDDRRNVYTELSLKVQSIVRDRSSAPVTENKEITIARWGGKVRIPSGEIQEWGLQGLGMPKVGLRYLMFLEPHSEEQFFYIWTAYCLTGEGILPIDKLDEKKLPLSSYKGADEAKFLQIVKASINK